MDAKLSVSLQANAEISEAFAWYEDQKNGLGTEFLVEVRSCIQRICKYPTANLKTKIRRDIRRALVRRFPYAIYYKHQNDLVEVHCVCHTRRNPEVWQKRLRDV